MSRAVIEDGKRVICVSCDQPLPREVLQRRYEEHVADCSDCRGGWACRWGLMYREGIEVLDADRGGI